MLFVKIILGFIINTLISKEERDYKHPRFNPIKIMIMMVLVLNLFVITPYLIFKIGQFYDFLDVRHPALLREFHAHLENQEKEKK